MLSPMGCSDVLSSAEEAKVTETSHPDATTPDPPDTGTSDTEVASDLRVASKHIPYEQTWYGGGVMYQIFPRSFADSDGDGIGDLQGILSKLDYLNTGTPNSSSDLKVSGLWLTPIFRSGSTHGYDTEDYKALDPVYGSLADLKALLQAAHQRGLRVILDLVINHSSRNHPWFLDSSSGPSATKRDWYVWSQTDPQWEHPFTTGSSPWHPLGGWYFYGVFSSAMPDLNLENNAVKQEIKSIIQYWLEQGVDGFRLDAVRYLIAKGPKSQIDIPETHTVLREFVAFARTIKPDVLFVGEAWTTTDAVAQYFGQGDEMDLCFQFDLVDAVDRTFQRSRSSSLQQTLNLMLQSYANLNFNAPVLGNHDLKRLFSRLGKSWAAAKLAATLLLTLPGTPFLYYGDELGLGNSTDAGDLSKRAPMQWENNTKAGFSSGIPWTRLAGQQEQISVQVQDKDPQSLLSWYRQVIRIRNSSLALRYGDMTLLSLDPTSANSALAYLRTYQGKPTLVILNFSDSQEVKPVLTLDPSLLQRVVGKQQDSLSKQEISLTAGTTPGTLTLPSLAAHTGWIIALP